MSTDVSQDPLAVNLKGGLLQNSGLVLNPVTVGLVGTSHTVTAYSPGSIVTGTCLNYLTQSIQLAYNSIGGLIDIGTYSNLIAIGQGTIPALGNSKAPTYSWYGPANTGDTTSTSAQAISWYPYTAYNTTNPYPSSNPTASQWSDLTETTYDFNITQWGWVRLFALQAWNEFNWNNAPTNSSIIYKDFLSSFQTCSSFATDAGKNITTAANSNTFLKNTYSNQDDLMTGDITGVNLATPVFGQDLIALGKAIDLSTIDKFGLPSALLLTLQKYNAIIGSLSYALLSSGLSTSDISGILNGSITPTRSQEQKIYSAFTIMTGPDLVNTLVPLNCSTQGLTSLSDLLNPIKLFPNSYQSLTVPVYNAAPGPTNAKTYYTIYNGTGLNTQLNLPSVINAIGSYAIGPVSTTAPGTNNIQIQPIGFGALTNGILPDDISVAAGAFSFSMQQISKIKNVPLEKFAQVVANLETTKDLPLTAGTDVPTNVTLANGGLTQTAYGSGPNGTYTISDFFGCMSGLPYQWTDIQNSILQLQTVNLSEIYYNIYNTLNNPPEDTDINPIIQGYIDQANTEIANILAAKPQQAALLNTMWNVTGTQLTIEQRARDIALVPVPVPRSNRLTPYPSAITGYVASMKDYAKQTGPNMHSQTITAISDMSKPEGQSQVALLRSSRNQDRLDSAGIPTNNDIPVDQTPITSKILAANGTVSTALPGQGIPAATPLPSENIPTGGTTTGNSPAPTATFTIPADTNVLTNVQPVGVYDTPTNTINTPTTTTSAPVLGTIPFTGSPLAANGAYVGQDLAGPNIVQVPNPITPISGGFLPSGPSTPINTGGPIVPGSLAGSPYQNLIPPELSIPFIASTQPSATYSVPDAIDKVVECNCDCWLQ